MLRIVKKVEDKDCSIEVDAAYAWNAAWKIDDMNNIPRQIRGSYKDRRFNDESDMYAMQSTKRTN